MFRNSKAYPPLDHAGRDEQEKRLRLRCGQRVRVLLFPALGYAAQERGDGVGLNWRIPLVSGKRAVRHALFDANYWKSFVQARLAAPIGDPGCLSLFGRTSRVGASSANERRRLLADHLCSEYRVKTVGRGRTVDEWKLRADGMDNHWLDCAVGAAVAASMQGAVLFGTDDHPPPRRRLRLSELQGRQR